ncbi:hypothetical protein K438DRAFT_1988301 [Mycena galopus ATCC 62051]|nr:hypothetical protein K438DRAFT_1988301 [Mycena galopus ATCC 62051]
MSNYVAVVNVLIDTGSTDLWDMPPQGLTNFNDTGLSTTLRYGTGANFFTGDIGIGAFQLDGGEFAVPQQAYLQGTSEAGEAGALALPRAPSLLFLLFTPFLLTPSPLF